MNSEMTDDQKEAFLKFSKLKVGALFMEMGTGKTRVALELAEYNRIGFLVYVCPKACIDNIKSEFAKWDYEGKWRIVGYETLSMSDGKFLSLRDEMGRESGAGEMIIADESIFIKNDSTIRFKRLCQLRDGCDYALILNGTPLTKNEWDLYNQMYFLSPKIIGMSRSDFQLNFFTHVIYKKRGHRERDFYKFSEVNAGALQKMIGPYVFKCDLDFGKSEEERFVWVPRRTESVRDYEKVKEGAFREFGRTGSPDAIIRMLQSLNEVSAMNEAKNEEVAEYCAGRKAIVYSEFIGEQRAIASLIPGCLVINGSTKPPERKRMIAEFLDSPAARPLLITFGCGSYSLNLQKCHEVVYSSLTFDYGEVRQSKARIRRIGQESDISYTYILTDSNVVRMILDNIGRKRSLDDLVRDDFMKGNSEKWKTV